MSEVSQSRADEGEGRRIHLDGALDIPLCVEFAKTLPDRHRLSGKAAAACSSVSRRIRSFTCSAVWAGTRFLVVGIAMDTSQVPGPVC